MTNETKKIMEDDSIAVSATCVRIPVLSAHSESVYIETKEVAPIEEVKAAIAAFQVQFLKMMLLTKSILKQLMLLVHVILSLDVSVRFGCRKRYPHCWVVSDNLLKGAAWNSVQIAETLHERGLVRPTTELKFELK